jgi:predicted transcriptional regulator
MSFLSLSVELSTVQKYRHFLNILSDKNKFLLRLLLEYKNQGIKECYKKCYLFAIY